MVQVSRVRCQRSEIHVRGMVFAGLTVLLRLEAHHRQGVVLLLARHAHLHDVHFYITLAEIHVGQARQEQVLTIGEEDCTHDLVQSVVKAYVTTRVHLQQPSIGFQSGEDHGKGRVG